MINALAELDRIGWKYDHASDDEIKCLCPFHEDHSPSCFVNIKNLLFKCHSCPAQGDFVTFLAGTLSKVLDKHITRADVALELKQRYIDLESDKFIDTAVIERCHSAIWESGPSLSALRTRGITDEDIRQYRIGFETSTNRITIPIKSESGLYVNIRRYMPGATGREKKMINKRGFGDDCLFPIDQLKYDTVMICGGELKAIAATRQLNKHGIGAITSTRGEGGWPSKFTKRFANKRVYVCYDIDKAGQEGAYSLCKALFKTTEWIGILELPLSPVDYPKGDINDFIGRCNGDLFNLLESITEFVPFDTVDEVSDEEIIEQVFGKVISAANTNKLVKFTATVSGKGDTPWTIPKELRIFCPRNKTYCESCAVQPDDPEKVYHIQSTSRTVLDCIDSPDIRVELALKKALGIPLQCSVSALKPSAFFGINMILVQPLLSAYERSEHKELPVYSEVQHVHPGDNVSITARVLSNPKNSVTTLIAKTFELQKDNLATFECADMEDLMIFRPSEWTVNGIEQVFNRRYNDLELNITKVYCRREMHILMDVVYHSVLQFNFRGQLTNGWIRGLIIGDTSQGKSKVAVAMQNHYGLGNIEDCKNSTLPGLQAAITTFNGNRYISWGSLVQNDRGLLIFEEATKLRDIISSLTNTFSSGLVSITKVVRGSAMARTRIAMLSNPAFGKTMADFVHGISAIRDVIGDPQDIRRLDLVHIINRNDITEQQKLDREKQKTAHIFKSELCHKLILWAWSRDIIQVNVSEELCILIKDISVRLIQDYSSNIPIIDEGSTYEKVARIALAVAAMTFSSDDEKHETLVLRACHVEYAELFMRRLYSSKACGYPEYAHSRQIAIKLRNVENLTKHCDGMRNPKEFVKLLLNTEHIQRENLMHLAGLDAMTTDKCINFLLNCHAIIPMDSSKQVRVGYTKTSEFINFLKNYLTTEIREKIQDEEEDPF